MKAATSTFRVRVLGVPAVLALWGALPLGCNTQPGQPLNPFVDLPAIAADGEAHTLSANIVPLGELEEGQVLRIQVDGNAVESVLVLATDEAFAEAGVLAGGGPAAAPFDYRVQRAGPYFVFVQFDPLASQAQRTGTITIAPGDPAFAPPARQVVQVVFAEGFLTDPGLFDPVDGTADDLAFLAEISDVVEQEVLDRLRAIFADTPIEIVGPNEAPPAPFSRLTFLPDRVPAENQDVSDAALPPADPARPQCQERVIFGEVLPRGARQDPGNQVGDDEAVVYVGSFQGRGEACWTSAVSSLNNVVLTLSQTAAHEIGHLVGLYHVEQIDIMNRSATLAFERELAFARGQVQLERLSGGAVISEVFTTVVQDPARYFQLAFDSSPK